jgi:hypothetical protein
MRIAISGSHRTGKSTLVDELSTLLPGYTTIDEPYHVMAEDGYEFCHPPSAEDYQAQLEHSIESLSEDETNVLFDRCPVDFLGYISIHEDADILDLDEWLPRVHVAIQMLDLIVFVPIEMRDAIAFSPSDDDEETRAAVDEKLREILLDDSLDLAVEVLEVDGGTERRVSTVMERIRQGPM